MNIFTKLLSPKSNNITNIDDSPLEGNHIVFSLDPKSNNEPHIKIRIDDTSHAACSKFAEMLHDLNSGLYHESIIKLMLQMSQQDSEIKTFIETTMLYWTYLLNKQNKEQTTDKPMIMPTDFNKHAK